jgi:hypothetical protein
MCLGCHTPTSNQRPRFRHDGRVDFAAIAPTAL